MDPSAYHTPAFRPTIAIFLGKTGENVRQQVALLYASLDDALAPSIAARADVDAARGAANAPSGSATQDSVAVLSYSPPQRWPLTSASGEPITDSFDRLLEAAFDEVQSNEVARRTQRAGYSTREFSAQFVVVGTTDDAADTADLAAVTDAIHKLLRKAEIHATVLYVLRRNRDGTYGNAPLPWEDVLGERRRDFVTSGAAAAPQALDESWFADLYAEMWSPKRRAAGTVGAETSFDSYAMPNGTADLFDTSHDLAPGAEDVDDVEDDGAVRVHFAFIYSRMADEKPPLLSLPEIEYAMAEAVFALSTTSLPLTSSFRQLLAQITGLREAEESMGSLGVSMIRFPRAAATDYYIARLGADLMAHWKLGMRELTEQRRAQLIQQARTFEESKLRPWVMSIVRVPAAQHGQWPARDTLQPATRDALKDLRDQTARVQGAISKDAIAAKASIRKRRGHGRASTWSEAAREARQKAEDEIRGRWEPLVQRAYRSVREEMSRHIQHTVDDFWLRDNGSWQEAQAWVEGLCGQLDELQDRLIAVREAHHDDYLADMAGYDRVARDWDLAEGSVLTGPGQLADITIVRPEQAPADPASDLSSLAGFGASAAPTQPGAAPVDGDTVMWGQTPTLSGPASTITHPPVVTQHPATTRPLPARDARERDILRRLGRRADAMENRVPRVPQLIAVAMAAAPALVLCALMLAPSGMFAGLLGLLVLLLGGVAFFAGCSTLFYLLRAYLRDRARQLHATALSRIMRYRLVSRTDRLSAWLATVVTDHVREMRRQLSNWPGHIQDISGQFAVDAQSAQRNLFEGPPKLRDVFVADGEELTETLAPVYERIEHVRRTAPRASWHKTIEEINERLRGELRQARDGVIGTAPERFREIIRDFLRRHFAPYLHGEIGKIGSALDPRSPNARHIWHQAHENAVPLYGRTGNDLFYIAGQPDDLASVERLDDTVAPGETLPTRVSQPNSEWLLIARLRRKGW